MKSTLQKALFSAARTAAKTLFLRPEAIKQEVARKAALAAAKVVNQDAAKAAGKAATTAFSKLFGPPSTNAYKNLLANKAGRSKSR